MDNRKNTCIVTYALIGLNVAYFLVSEVMGGSQDQAVMMKLGAAYTPYIMDGQIWRLFTSMFLHFGITHLMNNMIVLAALGENLELLLGHVRYLLIYLVGGLIGNIAGLAVDTITETYSISAGASGAIFSLMGAIVVLYLLRRDTFRMPVGRVAFGVVLALLPGFYMEEIDLVAHVGGMIGGMILTVPIALDKKFLR